MAARTSLRLVDGTRAFRKAAGTVSVEAFLLTGIRQVPTIGVIGFIEGWSASPDYSWSHTNPKRKRRPHNHLPSLALRVGIIQRVTESPGP